MADEQIGAHALGVEAIAGRIVEQALREIVLIPGDLLTLELAPGAEPLNIQGGDWVDYSSRLFSATARRGRTLEVNPFDVGKLTATLDNADRELDPFDDPDVAPNMPARLSVVANGNTRELITGFVDVGSLAFQFPSIHNVTFEATDGLRYVARDELDSRTIGSDTAIATVIGDYLDDLGWPSGDRAIDAAIRTYEASSYSGNGRGFLNLVTATEGPTAALFINRNGELDFRARRAITTDTRSTTAQVTFTNRNDTSGLTGAVRRYSSITLGVDDDTVFNKASVTRYGTGTAFTASDATSITNNGPRTRTHSGVYVDDLDPQADADLIVDLWKTAGARVTSLTTQQMADGPDFDTLVQLDIRDRIRLVHSMPGLPTPGAELDEDFIIEGISYSVAKASGGTRFIATYALASAAKFDALTGSY